MPDSLVAIRLAEFKARLLAMEAEQMRDMTQRWIGAENALRGAFDALAQDIATRLANGETISRNKLYQLERYRVMIAQSRLELAKYTDYTAASVTRMQSVYAQMGIENATEAIAVQYAEAGQLGASFGRLYVGAVDDIIARVAAGSPLRKLLTDSWPDAVEGLTQAIVDNIALGKNPRVLARAMRDGFDVGLNRAMVIARDQQLRVYRSANDAEYKASGVVERKKRMAAHDSRVCLACLVLDGELVPLDEPGYDHPQGRCTFVPVVAGMPEVQWQKGPEWFASLPEAQQRDMMGDKRFEAWKAGKFEFSQLAKQTEHDVWGKGLRVPGLKELENESVA